MPAVFVLIWSTGFVVARYGMPHAPPMGFLTVRYALSVLAFGVWVAFARAAWPQGRVQWAHLAVAGVLMHAGYLGGVWAAVKAGIGAGTVALIVGLQPVLTALWLSFAQGSQSIARQQWLGLLLGFGGLILVVGHKLADSQGNGEVTPFNLGLGLLALLSITVGTLYQKRFVQACDVRTANAVQLAAAFVVTRDMHPKLVGAMAWSVLVLTLGGSSMLYLLIQRGAAAKVTSLLYLVPPCTAVMAWLLFKEPLSAQVLGGIALTAAGVALVVRS
jgi:drug/metabolite transporter (DMT)-like permease